MLEHLRRHSRWGVSWRPGTLSVVEVLSVHQTSIKAGRRFAMSMPVGKTCLSGVELQEALRQVQSVWNVSRSDTGIELAIDDQFVPRMNVTLPASLPEDDLERAVSRAWVKATDSSDEYALDYVPLRVPVQGGARELSIYRVYGLRQSALDELQESVTLLGMKLLRVQPRSLALYHGVYQTLDWQAPHWLFELSEHALTVMGVNKYGDWVHRDWHFDSAKVQGDRADKVLAATSGDGLPWWLENIFESLQAFLIDQTEGLLKEQLAWAVMWAKGEWSDALAHRLNRFWQELSCVDGPSATQTDDWSTDLDALGAVWFSREGGA